MLEPWDLDMKKKNFLNALKQLKMLLKMFPIYSSIYSFAYYGTSYMHHGMNNVLKCRDQWKHEKAIRIPGWQLKIQWALSICKESVPEPQGILNSANNEIHWGCMW